MPYKYSTKFSVVFQISQIFQNQSQKSIAKIMQNNVHHFFNVRTVFDISFICDLELKFDFLLKKNYCSDIDFGSY
jgi:hypothetical protein